MQKSSEQYTAVLHVLQTRIQIKNLEEPRKHSPLLRFKAVFVIPLRCFRGIRLEHLNALMYYTNEI